MNGSITGSRIAYAFVDGGCRPNPGPTASAALLLDAIGNTITHRAIAGGDGTNVTAEWGGVLLALETALSAGVDDLTVCGDNETVMTEAFANDRAPQSHVEARVYELRRNFKRCVGRYIPRERNAAADYLCDSVFDGTYRPFEEAFEREGLLEVSYVVHLQLPAQSYKDRSARAQVKSSVTRAVRAALPVAVVAVKRVG